MTTSNRTKAGTTASTADDTSSVDAPVETEAPISADTSSPASLDAPVDVPAAEAPAVPAAEEEAPATAEQAKFQRGRVPITLAHPISRIENYRRLRLDSDPDRPDPAVGYPVGAVVWLVPEDAHAVIKAGYAQVDPEDKAAVRAAVRGVVPTA